MSKTKLELMPYCDGCAEISPKVEHMQTVSVLDEETQVSITCKNSAKCEKMRKHILSTIEEQDK